MLFENNLVHPRIMGDPEYGALILPISEVCSCGARFWVPYKSTNSWESETRSIERISFIPIEFKDLLTMLEVELPKNVPSHIMYFHELQNWYYFMHNKPFVNIENFDDKDGEVWIDISKKYRKFCGVEEDYTELVEEYHKERR